MSYIPYYLIFLDLFVCGLLFGLPIALVCKFGLKISWGSTFLLLVSWGLVWGLLGFLIGRGVLINGIVSSIVTLLLLRIFVNKARRNNFAQTGNRL